MSRLGRHPKRLALAVGLIVFGLGLIALTLITPTYIGAVLQR